MSYYIAEMAPDGVTVPPALLLEDSKSGIVAAVEVKAADEPFLHPKKAKKSVLLEKKFLSHDVVQFKFGLERDSQKLGLPTGAQLLFSSILRRTPPWTDCLRDSGVCTVIHSVGYRRD